MVNILDIRAISDKRSSETMTLNKTERKGHNMKETNALWFVIVKDLNTKATIFLYLTSCTVV